VTPTQTLDTRRQSRQARRQHSKHEATRHGWTHSALPLTATLADAIAEKARVFAGTARGDWAEDALDRAGIEA
jgi:hypothetical protein